MEFSKIKNEIWKVGFDYFCQAGMPNKFHKMTIVAESKKLNLQFWICVEGGYYCKDEFYIAWRRLDDIKAETSRKYCKNQSEVVLYLKEIAERIKVA